MTGVGGYASQQFKTPPNAQVAPSTPDEADDRQDKGSEPERRHPTPPTPSPEIDQPNDGDPPDADTASPTPPIPPEVSDWAEGALGTRPVFDADSHYPTCVATLREQDAVSRKEARTCRAELEQQHLNAVVGFYNIKRPYDAKLEEQEVVLREGGISQDELARYNYVTAEMERLNGDKSDILSSVHALETRLLSDIQSCRKSLCQSPG